MKKLIYFLIFSFAFGLELSELEHLKQNNFSGTFKQSKNIANFKKPILSEGNYSFVNEELFWHTLKPVEHSFKINASGSYNLINNAWVKSEQNYDKNLFLNIINFNFTALKKDFDIKLNGDKANWSMLLSPKNLWLKKIFLDIKITGDKTPKIIKIQEVNGDFSEIILQN